MRLVQESLASEHLSGDGPMTRRASQVLSTITGGKNHLLTPSCTHALELACRLLDLGPSDEVIVPSYNFPSSATAVALTGAKPIFVDVDRSTAGITAHHVARAISSSTKAIVLLHYAGVAADPLGIVALARQHGLYVIEDAAHGLGIQTKHGILGSFGDFAAYSFHETKNFQCGEGGSLQINNEIFLDRAEVLREKGTNRRRYFRGLVDKYSWIDHGSSWLLADPLAALLVGQLELFDEIQAQRRALVEQYRCELEDWAFRSGWEIQPKPRDQSEAAHMFHLVAPDLSVRQKFLDNLRVEGISAAFHYQPLHRSTAGRALGRSLDCPVSEKFGDRLVRLPLFATMTQTEIYSVINSVRTFS